MCRHLYLKDVGVCSEVWENGIRLATLLWPINCTLDLLHEFLKTEEEGISNNHCALESDNGLKSVWMITNGK